MSDAPYRLLPEVEAALGAGRPVLALESTVVGHGLPWPRNFEVARELERIAREAGVVPATIALIDGAIRVGLTESELRRIATEPSTKVSLRDIGPVLAKRELGTTTVAATLFVAARCGIGVFATGGIGGVHRGAATTFDTSNDLPALERERAIVICAGAKSILDLPATLERLETGGVTVVGYGTDEFPAFYTRTSGLPLHARADTPEEVARIARARRDAGLDGSVLVAVPIPEAHSVPADEIESALGAALARAAQAGIAGKALTPFLLAALAETTAGRSLEANVALLRQNASVGAAIARAWSELSAARGRSARIERAGDNARG